MRFSPPMLLLILMTAGCNLAQQARTEAEAFIRSEAAREWLEHGVRTAVDEVAGRIGEAVGAGLNEKLGPPTQVEARVGRALQETVSEAQGEASGWQAIALELLAATLASVGAVRLWRGPPEAVRVARRVGHANGEGPTA